MTQVKIAGPEINQVPILPVALSVSELQASLSPFRAWSPSLFSAALGIELLESVGTQSVWYLGPVASASPGTFRELQNPRSQLSTTGAESAF